MIRANRFAQIALRIARATQLTWHICIVNFARKICFELRIFLRQMLPKVFEPLFCGSEKSHKNSIPAKFPTKFPKFPCEQKKNSPTSFCSSAGRALSKFGIFSYLLGGGFFFVFPGLRRVWALCQARRIASSDAFSCPESSLQEDALSWRQKILGPCVKEN